jgi:hypothetical protein
MGIGLRAAAATAVAMLAIGTASAQAAELPRGDYACFLSGGGAGGSVQIKRDNKYTINGGKKGKYTYSKKRKIVDFKTGDYKPFFGKYVKRGKTIEIYDEKSGDYLWYCAR